MLWWPQLHVAAIADNIYLHCNQDICHNLKPYPHIVTINIELSNLNQIELYLINMFHNEMNGSVSVLLSHTHIIRCNKLLQPQIDTSTTSSAAFIITTIYCHCHCEHCHNLCHSTDAIIVVTTSANPVSIASTTVAVNFIITTSSIIALLLPPSP